MDASEIRWNEPARAKILDDADGVLRDAVMEVATKSGISSDDAFAELNARLKERFIDYEPGPDIRTYADAIAAGEFSGGGETTTADAGDAPRGRDSDDGSADDGPPTDAFSDEVRADAAEAGGGEAGTA